MDFLSALQVFKDRPELALVALLLVIIGVGIQRLFTSGFGLLGQHLENIDDNFKSVAKDLGGLRVDVAKVAERLEAREEIVDARFSDLDRRVTRLEDREENVR